MKSLIYQNEDNTSLDSVFDYESKALGSMNLLMSWVQICIDKRDIV